MGGAVTEMVGFGAFSTEDGSPRIGFRVGDGVLDLAAHGLGEVFEAQSLNPFLALGRAAWEDVVARVVELVSEGAELLPLETVEPRLPFEIGDYVDFFSSLEHATNAGRLFRPDGDPLHRELAAPPGRLPRARRVGRRQRDARGAPVRPVEGAG